MVERIAVETTQVLVLADGENVSAVANKRGHLFEQFVAQLLSTLGYEDAESSSLNVTSEGIELDVSARAVVTRQGLLAECKTYSSNVSAAMLTSFVGKYAVKHASDPQLAGIFVALPRLTAQGEEQAEATHKAFPLFRYLASRQITELLRNAKLLPSETDGPALCSDLTLIISEHGLALAAKELDPKTRRATRVAIWRSSAGVPDPILDLLSRTPYAEGMSVVPYGPDMPPVVPVTPGAPPTIVTVRGSDSDFEYQLPAAPRYFVGRKAVDASLRNLVTQRDAGGTIVINAKSGWGKSSLALQLARRTEQAGGVALVIDSRTADRADFVTAVLERISRLAASKKLLVLPSDAAFSSLASTIRTLEQAELRGRSRPLLVFFDQFENVFRNESLTRVFRDLALLVHELHVPLTVGFAWKTDLVGWTEAHPYQLRDEIRDVSTVTVLDPLGPAEIGILLGRLEKAVGQKLQRDLRRRLREYSQGLPWLFKKLGGHIISELRLGVRQEELVRAALNVQNLFETDLAALSPSEEAALRLIARSAPVPVTDLDTTVSSPVLESLLHKRLVVQVGERIDTYWDTFRDFLVTGRVAVEDSYIVRYGPSSVGKLLRRLIAAGGTMTVPQAASQLNTSTTFIFNLSRELRQFGLAAAEANRLEIDPAVLDGADAEVASRERTATALRRHKILPIVTGLLTDSPGAVPLSCLAEELPTAFPAIEANPGSWLVYARCFAQWLAFAGLAALDKDGLRRLDEGDEPTQHLLAGAAPARVRGVFPQGPAGPAEALLLHIADPATVARPEGRSSRTALRDLTVLGAITLDERDNLTLAREDLVSDGELSEDILATLVRRMPGLADALDALVENPAAKPHAVGAILQQSVGAQWSAASIVASGKYMRSWARLCGIETRRRPEPAPGL